MTGAPRAGTQFDALLRRQQADRLNGVVVVIALAFGVGVLLLGTLVKALGDFGGAFVAVGSGVVAAASYEAVTGRRDERWRQADRDGVVNIFKNRSIDFEASDWNKSISGARRSVCVLGVANHGFVRTATATEETTAAITRLMSRKDTNMTVLWLNPESAEARQREKQEGRATRRDTTYSIKAFWDIREALAERDRLHLLVYTTTPTIGVNWSDDELIITHYLEVQPNLRSPGLVLTTARRRVRGTVDQDARALTALYVENYNEIRAKATEIDAATITTFEAGAWMTETGLPSEAGLRAGVKPAESDPAPRVSASEPPEPST